MKEQIKERKKLQIIYKNNKPYGIRDAGGFLFFFTDISKWTGQEERYRREVQEQYDLADYLLNALSLAPSVTDEEIIKIINTRFKDCTGLYKRGIAMGMQVALKEFTHHLPSKGDESEYTQGFIDWRDKYFEYKPLVYEYRTKQNGARHTIKMMLLRYERAYNKSPFKQAIKEKGAEWKK